MKILPSKSVFGGRAWKISPQKVFLEVVHGNSPFKKCFWRSCMKILPSKSVFGGRAKKISPKKFIWRSCKKNIRPKDTFGGRAKKIFAQKMFLEVVQKKSTSKKCFWRSCKKNTPPKDAGVVQKKYATSNAGGRAKKIRSPEGNIRTRI
jgi:hypothetical protein